MRFHGGHGGRSWWCGGLGKAAGCQSWSSSSREGTVGPAGKRDLVIVSQYDYSVARKGYAQSNLVEDDLELMS